MRNETKRDWAIILSNTVSKEENVGGSKVPKVLRSEKVSLLLTVS